MANFSEIISMEQQCFITLAEHSKKPLVSDWPNNGKTLTDAEAESKNIGLLLGKKSGILDVDLDCMAAKALADVILPEPAVKFDRGSPDSGHYLFKASSFGSRKSFTANKSGSTLVELRGDGAQTMIPPSVHPNGNKLSFTALNEAANAVEYADLLKAVNLLAACSEIAQSWQEGLRHDLAMAFSGLARKQDLNANLVMQIVQRICQINNDPEEKDRLNTVRSTFSKPMDDLIGYKGLVACLGHSAAKRIADRIAAYSEKPRHFEIVNSKIEGGNIINFGQFSDKANVTEAKMGSTLGQWFIGRAVYVFEKKQWMIWNGCYWEADQRSIITKLAYQFVTEAKEALFDRGKYSDLSNLSQFESLNRLENIAKFASTDCSVSATEFDTDPLLLVSSSSWIDLGSGSSMVPNPKKLVSKALNVEHDQQASCPTFLQFLNDVFENDQDLIRFVQRAIGYSLTGSTSEQCLFIMIGDGANGKSTFINVINKLLGLYGTTAASQTLIANGGNSIGDDLVDLIGARLITVSETEEGQSLAEAKIKQMTGGDRLKGRPLYGSHIQFNIIGKLWLATNSLPQINNTDHGIWRRIKAIPFNRTFSAEEQDKNLSDKLLKELPGILNWAIEGCLDWQNNGLQTPDIVEAQVAEYRISMDSISQFIQDECEVDKDHSCAASKFFQAYRDWCSGAGRKSQSQASFKRSLEKITGVYQHRSSNGLQWHGIQPCLTY